jgi:hypothetical protein
MCRQTRTQPLSLYAGLATGLCAGGVQEATVAAAFVVLDTARVGIIEVQIE